MSNDSHIFVLLLAEVHMLLLHSQETSKVVVFHGNTMRAACTHLVIEGEVLLEEVARTNCEAAEVHVEML